jgi:tetratricopeptide (TPR) repeat protein
MRLLAMAALVCMTGLGAAAAQTDDPGGAQTAAFLAQEMRDFESNAALGTALTLRPGTQAELEEVDALAKRGLKAARDAVAQHPDSPEAHYLLGSWLLYGYRVVEVKSISIGPQGGQWTETVRTVVLGLSDSTDEGIAALRRATELAPDRGDYFIDYAAALFDCARPLEAMSLLKQAWAGQPELTTEDRTRAGLLLSDILASQDRLAEAREWVYSALLVNPVNVAAVQRLRQLDAAEAASLEVMEEAIPEEFAPEEPVFDEDEGEVYYEEEPGEGEAYYEEEPGEGEVYYEEELGEEEPYPEWNE